jgi:hypothetical protein
MADQSSSRVVFATFVKEKLGRFVFRANAIVLSQRSEASDEPRSAAKVYAL